MRKTQISVRMVCEQTSHLVAPAAKVFGGPTLTDKSEMKYAHTITALALCANVAQAQISSFGEPPPSAGKKIADQIDNKVKSFFSGLLGQETKMGSTTFDPTTNKKFKFVEEFDLGCKETAYVDAGIFMKHYIFVDCNGSVVDEEHIPADQQSDMLQHRYAALAELREAESKRLDEEHRRLAEKQAAEKDAAKQKAEVAALWNAIKGAGGIFVVRSEKTCLDGDKSALMNQARNLSDVWSLSQCYVPSERSQTLTVNIGNVKNTSMKDVGFTCIGTAPSGTVLTRVKSMAYDKWNPGDIKQFTVEIDRHPQVKSYSCSIN
ncbi:hypothetical protein H663_019540 [Limnohabitans planktonicus II-D5]|uniref:Uncharacterized protein n=2 Tax=Limnohabitans planktonicus TaxID=540060 RepID=A0A2T7U8M8_9BURK|nr:hypothetical protein H663_019540 [Limnohabitans planktonicus II-D5]|eukprot:gene25296-30545_t